MLRPPMLAMLLGTALAALAVSCHSDGQGPLSTHATYESSSAALSPIRVAIYNHANTSLDTSYFNATGQTDNIYSAVQTVLNADPQGRFAVTVVTDLSAATLANYDRIVLPDNLVTDADLTSVAKWFQPGTGIIAIDSAVAYACNSGFLIPACSGVSGAGKGTYWDYNSGPNNQRVVTSDPDTAGYTLGAIISSTLGHAELISDAGTVLTRSSQTSRAYAAYRDVPNSGRITLLGPINPGPATAIPANEQSLLQNAVANANTLALGSACVAGGRCSSGYCSDGVCCDQACSGNCDACSVTAGASANGTCTILSATAAGNPSCAPYLCSGTSAACESSCSSDAQCDSTDYCSGGQCVLRFKNGSSCSAGDQCITGFCPDGICCSSGNSCAPYVCGSAANSCLSSCTTDAQCASGAYCSGGQCQFKASRGGACSANDQCTTGFCANNVCCNAACNDGCDVCAFALGASADGTCTTLTKGSASTACSPLVCTGSSNSCPTSCSADADCITGDYCQNGQCHTKVTQGTTCGANNQCTTGFCSDGVCCDTACSGGCDACAAGTGATRNGTCTTLAKGSTGESGTCAPFVCDGANGACPTTCASDTDCATNAWCAGGVCKLKSSNGGTCSGADQCTSGFCSDGVCCNTACSGACDVCSTGTCTFAPAQAAGNPSCSPYTCGGNSVACRTSCGNDGDCAGGYYCDGATKSCVPQEALGGSCSRTTMCQSGFCADGVCCNSGCSGSCDACNLTGSVGTCSPMPQGSAGSPGCSGNFVCDGTNTSCPTTCTSDLQCPANRYCSNGSCVSQQANGKTCSRAQQCSSGFCADGYCCNSACDGSCDVCAATLGASGNGKCTILSAGAGGSPACAPYLCDGANATCPATCTADKQCAAGDYCDATGHCSPQETNGAACVRAGQCASGSCADGVCCNTSCSGTCNACAAADGASADGLCTDVVGPHGCGLYMCTGASADCPSTCSSNADCTGGAFCKAGACILPQVNGATCAFPSQCASGNCVDGVCCNTACGGCCDVCAWSLGAAADGVCTIMPAGAPGAPSCAPFTCDGTSAACATSCSSDSDCASGAWCNNGTCAPKGNPGATCTNADECASGFCVDGVCCDSACTDGCEVCSAALGAPADGTCSTAPAQSLGNPSCSPYRCDGQATTCPSSCASDPDCVSGSYCDAGTHQCVPVNPIGSACTTASQCTSGFCSDGVCCDTACDGGCDVCAASLGASADGTCTIVGTGKAGANPLCTPYLCDGKNAACPATCSADSDCVAGDRCAAGQCVPKETNGLVCSSSAQCASGFCVDGVCCDTACTDQCASCNQPTKAGTCSPAPAGPPVGNRMSCQSDGSACGGACDGMRTAACAYPDVGSTCGTGSCADGVATPAPLCDGRGACKPQPAVTCQPYLCVQGGCTNSCASDQDCAMGSRCSEGQCVAPLPLGATCAANGDCTSGFCVEGLCCDSACSGSCETCSAQGSEGTCTPLPPHTAPANGDCAPLLCDGSNPDCPTICTSSADCTSGFVCVQGSCSPVKGNGGQCATAGECASGNCIDGVCCDKPCDGSCEACALPGHEGTCALVTGAAASGRQACVGSGVCGGVCDGQHAACSYPSSETTCEPGFCSNGVATAAATCDGAGTCGPGQQTECVAGCAGSQCAPPATVAHQGGCTSAEPGSAGLLLLGLIAWMRRRRPGADSAPTGG